MDSRNLTLSVLIPCYNEETNLQKNLPKIQEQLQPEKILVVDDGSTDKTRNVAEQKGCDITPKRENKGKGCSVRQGLKELDTDLVLLTDADLSAPLKEYQKLRSNIEDADIAIGSRGLPGSEEETTLSKKIGGKAGNFLIRNLLGLPYKDTQCGFKLFKQKAIQNIFPKMTLNGFGYDFELLLIAKRQGIQTAEVPIEWNIDHDSHVKPSDYMKTLLELYTVKWNDLNNVYG